MSEPVTREWVEETFEYVDTEHSPFGLWYVYSMSTGINLHCWPKLGNKWTVDAGEVAYTEGYDRTTLLTLLAPFLKKKPMRTITVEVPHDFPEPPEVGTYHVGFAEKKGSYWFTSAGWSTNLFDDSCPTAVLHCVPASKPFNPLDHVSSDTMVAFKTRNGEKAWAIATPCKQYLKGVWGEDCWGGQTWNKDGRYSDLDDFSFDLVALWEEE